MFLTIHDAQLRKVAFVDNEKQGTLDFFDDTWTRNLQTGSSTYEFSISKKSLVSDTVFNRTYSYLNERAFVSFEYKGETFLFNVMTVEEDEKKIKCYCENLNLELINEYSNPFKADRAMSFVEYCNAMDLLNMTKLSVGINEISDYKRTLEWEGQDTKLARLISLANKFDAEIDFKTYLNDDSTIKQFLVNVYHENDGVNYHGVGRDRKDITLVYGKNLKSIKRKVDKTNIFNMIVPTAQSEENSDQKLTIGSLPNWELKNDKGIVEFYKRGDAIYAPISAQLYPSTFTSETQSDQWTRRDMDFNVKSIQQLETEGLKQLKASAYPELTYEFDGYIDADIGDTVELSDGGFANTLLIEARIFEQKLSFSTKKNWKTTLGNFRALQSKLSNDIQSELERLVEDAKPYNIRISTDNGTMFKNNEGESLVKATLWKGGKVVNQDVTWRWALDGNVTVGMQYLAKAENINDTAVLTVAAYVGNNEVATTEITLTNVNDGIAGKDGVGLKSTVVTYGLSTSETTQPTSWTAQVPALTKGNYLWTKTVWTYTDNTSETGYQKTYIAKDGNDGNDGIAGKDGVGIKATTITYASSTSGTTKPTSGWTSTIPSVPAGNYLWTKTIWTYTDNTSETGYSVAKMGETGPQGPKGEQGIAGATGPTGAQGPKGADGRTSYIHIKYAPVSNPSDSQITDTPNTYIGIYTDYNLADSTKASDYTWSKWKGSDGAQGIQGPKGADGRTTYVHFAYANMTFVANENSSFTLTERAIVRFGKDDKWIYKTLDAGTYKADVATFGRDPYSKIIKVAEVVNDFSVENSANKAYVGVCTDYTEADSTNPSDYGWTLIKGEKGDKGDTGPQGIQGLQGPKGDQGIQGPKGADGKTQYTHIAYADNTTGGGFSQTDQTKAYIGMYQDFTATDSTDPTKYRWTKWKGSDGAQGIPGKPGADGKTPYIHFAYADDKKGTNFSLTDNNQQYQGYYSDYTQADSTDYTKYKWVDRLANVKGGSRNYFKNSLTKTFYTTDAQTFDWRTYIVDAFWKNKDRLKKNFVKISFDITFPVALENDYTANIHFSATPWYANRVTFKAGTTSRQHFEFGIDLSSASEDYHTDNVFIRFGTNYGFPSDFKIILENMMLSIGSYYPDYIQAIEDTQEQIDSKADSALTQQQLNALEAKRLQMEVELKAKATLEQVSELETFINNLKQEDTDGRQKIIEITKNIEDRVKDVEPIMEYSKKLQFMDTYITQGNGGMVIGANDSSTKLVVTPDRISFQSGGSEVAYISQSMLHIDNGVFTMSLQLGHYITRAHPKNKYVNATYFVK